MEKYKVIIIGSGIAGMTASINLKRAGINPLIIENNVPGGTLNYIPNIENYPGYESISGPDLAMNIYNQVNNLGIKIKYMNIDNIDLNKKIINNEISFDYLIIATGRKNKTLGIDNEDKLLGKGISTCALCDGMFYKDKDVIVVGGGSSALTESLYLANICRKVTIIIRKEAFTGHKYLIDRVENTKNIKVINNSNIIKYNIKDNILVSVTLDNNKKIKTNAVFFALGGTPNSELFNVDKDHNYIIVNDKYQTNIPYVFAIGDVIKKDYYQLTTAAGDAVIASNNIIRINNER